MKRANRFATAVLLVAITEQTAKAHNIPVTILTDMNHCIQSSYSEVITVEQEMMLSTSPCLAWIERNIS